MPPTVSPAVQPVKKLNVMRAAEPPSDGPYLSIEVEPVTGAGPVCVRMVGHLDSGSDFDGVGRNWVPHLVACGGVVVPLKVPEFIGWTDRSVARYSTAKVNMRVRVFSERESSISRERIVCLSVFLGRRIV